MERADLDRGRSRYRSISRSPSHSPSHSPSRSRSRGRSRSPPGRHMTLANSRYGPEVETRLAVFAQDQESANRHARNNITPHDRLVNMSNIESEEALYSASGEPINVAKQYLNKDAAVSKYFDEEVIFNSSHTNIDRGRRDCLSKYVPDDLVGTSPPPLPRQHRAQPRQQYAHDPTSPDYSTESDESSVLSSTPSFSTPSDLNATSSLSRIRIRTR